MSRHPPCLVDSEGGGLEYVEHEIEFLYGATDPHPIALTCTECGWRGQVC